ncbi:bifunctional riboflavin kinase/FAD synthetase [Kordiimonas sp. SCSIO 12610]|uniref:bifunctional riboflavin kinase/FAD synthetase n=1 Tax=Kordiimonas sp. SCSIO 12610 TaxID=2829597 RepID=UPI00210E1F59|nr:bifunctional riboflavin kinase/FAD synthetase [Kordiimonas sp. SCSIO 12610]UTW54856.1 bifunctional riboflavin kinase/FAD synthetase [Kordiimonas sp. SCSIO 12610]
MKIFEHIDIINNQANGCVIALGNFDGFHRGHHVVVGEAGRKARELGVPLTVVVMEPHPVSFFAPDKPPFRLTTASERALLLEKFGVDQLVVLPFDSSLASMSASDFIADILVKRLNTKHVCVGYDYRFGKGRAGDTNMLEASGRELGFGLTVINPVTVGIEGFAGDVYSSTLVRTALSDGRARQAAALLGHWWIINGKVVKGDQRGRTIDFPTANIELGENLQPKLGVYAVRVKLGEDDTIYNGVANIGKRPTFDKRDVLMEVFLFNFSGDIYGCDARVEIVSFIRSEQKFAGLEDLKEQIAKDVESAARLLSDPENDRDHLHLPSLDEYLDRFPAQHDKAAVKHTV